nr:hypothetical protein [Pseudobythopirellula maris]
MIFATQPYDSRYSRWRCAYSSITPAALLTSISPEPRMNIHTPAVWLRSLKKQMLPTKNIALPASPTTTNAQA